MTDPTPRIINCPTCNTAVKWTSGNVYRPFCSERCKLIDLGAWADGTNSIPGSSNDEDEVLSGDLDDPQQQ